MEHEIISPLWGLLKPLMSMKYKNENILFLKFGSEEASDESSSYLRFCSWLFHTLRTYRDFQKQTHPTLWIFFNICETILFFLFLIV